MSLALDDVQLGQLMAYLDLFIKWNKAYNLSAIREPSDIVSKHLLDSLSIADYLEGMRFIDVGTGGGLPGIPLAIVFPHRHFTLLDSAGKKTRFLFQVMQSLGLKNLAIENCRAETFQPEVFYDGVISRAFASLTDMTKYCGHLIAESGRFYAMKGVFPEHELSALGESFNVESHFPLQVSGLDEERCLIVLKKQQNEH